MYMGNRENLTRNNPTMNREYEQPGTNMGDTGEQINKQPTQRKARCDGKTKGIEPLQPNGKRRGSKKK